MLLVGEQEGHPDCITSEVLGGDDLHWFQLGCHCHYLQTYFVPIKSTIGVRV